MSTTALGQSAHLSIPNLFAGERGSGKTTWLLGEFIRKADKNDVLVVPNQYSVTYLKILIKDALSNSPDLLDGTPWKARPIPIRVSTSPDWCRGISGALYIDEIQALDPRFLTVLIPSLKIKAATLNVGRG